MTAYQPVKVDSLEPDIQKRVITTMIAGMQMNDIGGKKAPFQIPPAVALSIVKALDLLPRPAKTPTSRRDYMRKYMQEYRAKARTKITLSSSSSGTPPVAQQV